MDEFKTIGLDTVVGSVETAARSVSSVISKELPTQKDACSPYFFPDTFREGGDPCEGGKDKLGDRQKGYLEESLTGSDTAAI